MQNTQNNLTVENLIIKYRNYIMEHSPKQWTSDGVQVFEAPISLDDVRADEQLLVTLYSSVAGNEADEQILSVLSQYAENYQSAALNEKEFTFLCEHFDEVISYEFSHMKQWSVERSDESNMFSEILPLIREMAKIQEGQNVFIEDAGYCDFALLFPKCTVRGFTGVLNGFSIDEVWALGQIRLFATGIKSEIVPGSWDEETGYHFHLSEDEHADVIICNTFWNNEETIRQLYLRLNPKGKMFIVTNRGCLAGDGRMKKLRQQLVREKAIHTIVSFKNWGIIVPRLAPLEEMLLVLQRNENENVLLKNTIHGYSFLVKAEELDEDILWPGYYMAKRPQNGIPLSRLVSIPQLKRSFRVDIEKGLLIEEDIKDVPQLPKSYIIKELEGDWGEEIKEIAVIDTDNLSNQYKEANICIDFLKKLSDSSNGRNVWDVYTIDSSSVMLYGNENSMIVGYIEDHPIKGLAIDGLISCLCPHTNIDVRYIAALLLSPIVRDQILTMCDGVVMNSMLPLILDKIIVPNHDEKERLNFLAEANYNALISLQKEYKESQKQYKKSVRMRKHALTQSLSSIEAMFCALNAYRIRKEGTINDRDVISRVKGTTVREAFDFLAQNIDDMMPALEHIADVEYTFKKPKWIDPEIFIEDYIFQHENGWLNFKPIMTWENGHNIAKEDIKNPSNGEIILQKGQSINQFFFPEDALARVFKNIISNAKSHGFTEKERKDYRLKFSWHMEGAALIIEIENNGTPIPHDRDTASLLEYGVSTALHHDGHNGIGCNEIDDIMQRYDGKVEIVSTPENEFTVKYILTFNRSNTGRTF